NIVPAGMKSICGLFPAQTPCPPCQKKLVGAAKGTFALRPWHLLNLYPAMPAVNPAHAIAQVALISPQRHELKQSWLFGNIVAGGFALAAGANRTAARTRTHLGNHSMLPVDTLKPHQRIN